MEDHPYYDSKKRKDWEKFYTRLAPVIVFILLILGLLLFPGCCQVEETQPCELERTYEITFTNDADCLIGVAIGRIEHDHNPAAMFKLEPGESDTYTLVTGELLVLAAADSLWDYHGKIIHGPAMHWETTEFYPCEEIDYRITDPLKE